LRAVATVHSEGNLPALILPASKATMVPRLTTDTPERTTV
jgi:hypothetical protein